MPDVMLSETILGPEPAVRSSSGRVGDRSPTCLVSRPRWDSRWGANARWPSRAGSRCSIASPSTASRVSPSRPVRRSPRWQSNTRVALEAAGSAGRRDRGIDRGRHRLAPRRCATGPGQASRARHHRRHAERERAERWLSVRTRTSRTVGFGRPTGTCTRSARRQRSSRAVMGAIGWTIGPRLSPPPDGPDDRPQRARGLAGLRRDVASRPRSRVPTLVIGTRRDPVFAPTYANDLAALHPAGQGRDHPRLGHAFPPTAIEEHISPFLG